MLSCHARGTSRTRSYWHRTKPCHWTDLTSFDSIKNEDYGVIGFVCWTFGTQIYFVICDVDPPARLKTVMPIHDKAHACIPAIVSFKPAAFHFLLILFTCGLCSYWRMKNCIVYDTCMTHNRCPKKRQTCGLRPQIFYTINISMVTTMSSDQNIRWSFCLPYISSVCLIICFRRQVLRWFHSLLTPSAQTKHSSPWLPIVTNWTYGPHTVQDSHSRIHARVHCEFTDVCHGTRYIP